MIELSALNDIVAGLQAKNANLVAISPVLPEKNRALVEAQGLNFEILYDAGNQYAQELDLVHGFSDELKQVYLTFGIDLEPANGDSSWTLPIPTRMVIDSEHRIQAIETNADYTKRPEPTDTLAAI